MSRDLGIGFDGRCVSPSNGGSDFGDRPAPMLAGGADVYDCWQLRGGLNGCGCGHLEVYGGPGCGCCVWEMRFGSLHFLLMV